MALFDKFDNLVDDFLDDTLENAEDVKDRNRIRRAADKKLVDLLKGKKLDGKPIRKIQFVPIKGKESNFVGVKINGVVYKDHNDLENRFSEGAKYSGFASGRFMFSTEDGKISIDTLDMKRSLVSQQGSKILKVKGLNVDYKEALKNYRKQHADLDPKAAAWKFKKEINMSNWKKELIEDLSQPKGKWVGFKD